MILFANFDTPQDIYIFGSYIEHDIVDKHGSMKKNIFGITDDFHSLTVSNGKAKTTIETCGFVYVFTKEQLLKIIDDFDEEDINEEEGIILKNYSGEIRLKIITEVRRYDPDFDEDIDILDSYDPEEYLMYQKEMRETLEKLGDGDMDFVLEFDAEIPKVLKMKKLISIFKEENNV